MLMTFRRIKQAHYHVDNVDAETDVVVIHYICDMRLMVVF